jgi:hypothetical protein
LKIISLGKADSAIFLNPLKLLAASGEEMSLRIRRSQSSILYNNFFCVRLPRRKQRGSAIRWLADKHQRMADGEANALTGFRKD